MSLKSTSREKKFHLNILKTKAIIKKNIPLDIAQKYDPRFKAKDIIDLFEKGILPELANKYPLDYSGTQIIELHEHKIEFKKAEEYTKRFNLNDLDFLERQQVSVFDALKYDPRFDVFDISTLFHAHCPPQLAAKYKQRFNGYDITHLIEANVAPSKANSYQKKFEASDVIDFKKNNISPKKVRLYNSEIHAYQIIKLINKNCSQEKLENYLKKFEKFEALKLIESDVSPEAAEKYMPRFSAYDIAKFVKEKISYEVAKTYDPRFNSLDIVNLVKKNIPNERILSYDKRFSGSDLVDFLEAGISPSLANAYDQRFDGSDILGLAGVLSQTIVKDFLSPQPRFCIGLDELDLEEYEVVNASWNDEGDKIIKDLIKKLKKPKVPNNVALLYDKRFNGREISELIKLHVSPKLANAYDQKFSGHSVVKLAEAGISLNESKKYSSRFDETDLLYLAGIKPSVVHRFNKRFTGQDLKYLVNFRISPKLADAYPLRFDGIQISTMSDMGISAETAHRYHLGFDGTEITILNQLGIKPENTALELQEKLFHVFSKIVNTPQITQDIYRHALLGVGNHAVVLFDKSRKSAYKFSLNLKEELRLLHKLRKSNSETLRNVINFYQSEQKTEFGLVDMIELDYVQGKTLYQLLTLDKERFSKEKNLRYAAGIFKGLLELKTAEIYHRDLWLGNIIVDELKDRAVIIDLGISTDEKNSIPKDNRRYGGENDLQSLGQIMYKMSTGKHIFNTTIDTSTILIPDEIKAERERAYADPKTLERRLELVDTYVKEDLFKEAIKVSLRSKGSEKDYTLLTDLFKDIITEDNVLEVVPDDDIPW